MNELKDKVEQEVESSFAYTLLRNDLLPDLLGKEERSILYWAGKHLARKYPLDNLEEICDFFNKALWGQLLVAKEKKNKIIFHLVPHDNPPEHYQLEAGFLAAQFEALNNCVTETFEQIKRKHVEFTVESNPKTSI